MSNKKMSLDEKKFKVSLSEAFIKLLESNRGIAAKLAKAIGKSGSFINEVKRGKPVNALHLKAIGLVYGYEKAIQLLSIDDNCEERTNKHGVSASEETESKKEGVIVIDHSDLVKELESQDMVKEINENLIKIEKKNKQAFRDIYSYIQGVANGLDYSLRKQSYPPSVEDRTALKKKKETT